MSILASGTYVFLDTDGEASVGNTEIRENDLDGVTRNA